MPKSKKRKMRYTPRPKTAQQQPLITTAQPVERIVEPVRTTASQPIKISRPAGKTQAIPQPVNIGTELKIIGVITIILLAAIVALYFVFR
jgi:hypothetical protein